MTCAQEFGATFAYGMPRPEASSINLTDAVLRCTNGDKKTIYAKDWSPVITSSIQVEHTNWDGTPKDLQDEVYSLGCVSGESPKTVLDQKWSVGLAGSTFAALYGRTNGETFWVKNNNQWSTVDEVQNVGPVCSTIQKYQIPVQLTGSVCRTDIDNGLFIEHLITRNSILCI